MRASIDGVETTVNSVVARWSITVDGRGCSSPGPVTVVAILRPLQAKGDDPTERRDSQRLEFAAGHSGEPQAGCSEFHFLAAGRRYGLSLVAEGFGELAAEREVQTQPAGRDVPREIVRLLPEDFWPTYVGKEHTLGEWLSSAPEDFVWAFSPDFSLMRSLWLNACFTLLSNDSPITQCPNPSKRYCLDLAKPSQWLRGKKVKRHKSDFSLTVNGDYTGTFARCEALHREQGKGTWITPDLVQALDRCRREGGDLKVYSIELWEKSTGKLAAAIMALSVGDIFHDYTMATMMRDDRSPGAILSKVVGHLLVECGYKLWYWGFKNPYMAEYDGHYGGLLLDSKEEFWPRWKAARRLATPCDLSSRVPPGRENALDLATL